MRQLAEEIGVSVGVICMWEGYGAYKVSPSTRNLTKAVEALGLTMERFYGRTPKPKKTAA